MPYLMPVQAMMFNLAVSWMILPFELWRMSCPTLKDQIASTEQ